MFLLRAVLNMIVRNASPRSPMCFRCLIFNLSGHCELLFFTLFYSLLDLRSSECDVVSLYVVCCSVNVWFVNCLVKLLDRPSKDCVCCVCDLNERLRVPSIFLFVFLYVGSYLLI